LAFDYQGATAWFGGWSCSAFGSQSGQEDYPKEGRLIRFHNWETCLWDICEELEKLIQNLKNQKNLI
jgi:hypothetical protein